MSWGFAMCTCGEPLVSTGSFSRFEFVCVVCGRKYTYFGPQGSKPETPELEARAKELEAEWDELSKGLLSGGVMFKACEQCRASVRPHLFHANPDELVAHEMALARLSERWKLAEATR